MDSDTKARSRGKITYDIEIHLVSERFIVVGTKFERASGSHPDLEAQFQIQQVEPFTPA